MNYSSHKVLALGLAAAIAVLGLASALRPVARPSEGQHQPRPRFRSSRPCPGSVRGPPADHRFPDEERRLQKIEEIMKVQGIGEKVDEGHQGPDHVGGEGAPK